MEGSIWRIILCIGVIISCTNVMVGATNMYSCAISPHSENSTLEVTIGADSNDHDGIKFEFKNDLGYITEIPGCSHIIVTFTKETCTVAADYRSFEITYAKINDDIVVKFGDFDFPQIGGTYASGTIRVTMKLGPDNPNDYGDTENCPAFTTPSYTSGTS